MPCPKNKSKRRAISFPFSVLTFPFSAPDPQNLRTQTHLINIIYKNTTMEWFECKVQYDKTQENGLIKSTKEAYLVDALSFTEAEETITKEMEPFMSGEFVVSDIKRARIAELFENEDLNADRWYRVKVGFISFDEKSEKEKVITQTDLVQATDLKNAIETLEKGMQGTLGDYKIISVTETPLIDVFRHKVEE